ncbi:hypothetical protein B0H11DRAFT_2244264 [Mycena galericulata]|nr:hypothetical protein B0H11DRAFT_2244264 [Mycena galericulata]
MTAAGRTHPHDDAAVDVLDPIALYSRALQTYTLRLWTESLKAAEERRRTKKEAARAVHHDLKLKKRIEVSECFDTGSTPTPCP